MKSFTEGKEKTCLYGPLFIKEIMKKKLKRETIDSKRANNEANKGQIIIFTPISNKPIIA